MRVRDVNVVVAPTDSARPPVAPRRRSRVRAALGAMLGIPIVVVAAIATLLVFDRTPEVVAGQQIALRTAGGGSSTALVFGAGTGIHLVRVTEAGVPLAADLSAGMLRIVSLRSLRLDAHGVSGQDVSVSATAHTLRLQSDRGGVGVRTGL